MDAAPHRSRAARGHRSPLLALLAVLGVLAATLLGTGTAQAASYRSWGYFQQTGSGWTFATKGPAQTTPRDGSVEGWRFAVAGMQPRTPRATPSFEQVCGGTEPAEGRKRVAVVLDYGRSADAESGTPPRARAACAQVPTAATGAQVLAAVGTPRTDKGMVCGIDQWPATGCATEVKQVSQAAAAKDDTVSLAMPSAEQEDEQGAPVGLLVAGAVVVVLVVAALLLVLRRRRRLERA